jgi:cell division protein FtsL
MLEQRQVNLGTILTWLGATVATVLLILNLIREVPGLGAMAVAVALVTSTHALRLTLLKRDRLLREAFELGRDHERLKSVRAL